MATVKYIYLQKIKPNFIAETINFEAIIGISKIKVETKI